MRSVSSLVFSFIFPFLPEIDFGWVADIDAGLCANLVQGAATVLPSEYFDAALTLNAVQKYRCTGLYGVTTMFIDQLSHPDFSQTDRSSLRCVPTLPFPLK
jgi:acyl-CoA synthetase (AMP-forming)/AMP-acid ligase II